MCLNMAHLFVCFAVVFWLALPVGNEGPSTFTNWYIGDETEPSFPTGRAS